MVISPFWNYVSASPVAKILASREDPDGFSSWQTLEMNYYTLTPAMIRMRMHVCHADQACHAYDTHLPRKILKAVAQFSLIQANDALAL